MATSENIGSEPLNKQSVLSEKMDMLLKQVSRLEKLIGLNIQQNPIVDTKIPVLSKFDGMAVALDEIRERLMQCNVEVEKL